MGNPHLTKVFTFCAAHQYGHEDWSAERNEAVFGPDARVHGHNYTLEITVTGDIDPDTGYLIDLGKLKSIVESRVIDVLDHRRIERDIPWFQGKQPSSEHMVQFIWEQIVEELKPVQLVRVRLRETPTIYTDYAG